MGLTAFEGFLKAGGLRRVVENAGVEIHERLFADEDETNISSASLVLFFVVEESGETVGAFGTKFQQSGSIVGLAVVFARGWAGVCA